MKDGEKRTKYYYWIDRYEMKTTAEFLSDLTRINPEIKLEKTVKEWRDDPKTTYYRYE